VPASTAPRRILTVPGGNPAWIASSPRNNVDNGFISLALVIMTFPTASAGAAFIANVIIGLLKELMAAQIPRGSWRTTYKVVSKEQ
jgi:hypothetical protein